MIEAQAVSLATILCYGFLYVSVLSLWFPYKFRIQVWILPFFIACGFGWMSNRIEGYAIFPISVLAYALYFSAKPDAHIVGRIIGVVTAIFFSYGFGIHLFPYFHNLNVVSAAYISRDGVPFTMDLNIDNMLVGLLILGLTQHLLYAKDEWILMCKQLIPKALILILALMLTAMAAGYVHFDPKLPQCLPIWLITNLLFVSAAEESFFRGLIQKNLVLLFKNFVGGKFLAIILSALLFGLAHHSLGIIFSIWAFAAGVGYGWIYQQTNRIEASILTHFSLNLIHFLLFTYPVVKL